MSEQTDSRSNRSLELCKRVVTTESFIAEAKETYGDRYDYSKVDYKNKDHRVTIVCPVHGAFQVYAREHLDGKGCPKCEKGKKFLLKLKEKFGDKFGLDEFVYESSTTPVTLVCSKHGAFSRLPHQILNSSQGCPECANNIVKQKQEEAQIAAKKAMEGKRLVATKAAIERFRSEHPTYTDDYITELVNSTYPNKFEDTFEVAIEVIKEIYRSQTNLTDDTFINLLKKWAEEGSLNSYEIETRKQWKTIENRRNLLNRIYSDARTKTVYLSQYEEYQDKGVQRYYEERCRDKERTLAKQLFYDLNQMALDEAGGLSGFILPFHCYSEPNGDVVFTKNKRTRADYDANGNPVKSENDFQTSKYAAKVQERHNGCLSILIFCTYLFLYYCCTLI